MRRAAATGSSRSPPHYRRRRSVPPPSVGVGIGKRRWYATIFSLDRPRSRSISTERRGMSLSRAGFTPRSSSPWPLSCRPLVFTRADSSVFIPTVPPELFHVSTVTLMTTRIVLMVYLASLTGMRRLAIAPSERLGGLCQSNADLSMRCAICPRAIDDLRRKGAPLRQCGRASLLVNLRSSGQCRAGIPLRRW